ncbi:cytochrome c3 family protein [Lysinibacillus piscis]|uniref:Bh protein n=1 Tax=Lysinibacillus piscis TaxID=2518931 RepID=A0ABQ5NGH0_9BACI|nr:cytochrome c3 family protein [Lysinibacillus sp. KH24]GLC87141.1 hypothetical protein LYSBPC_02680 [Lysinibacillus sp. KH24]
MKISEMEAGLYCTRCHDETVHRVVYVNNKIQKIECEACHRLTGMEVDLKKEIYDEVYERIATKPSRMTQEYKQDLSKFVSEMPMRVISKPYRLMKDVNEARKALKRTKHP